MIPSFDCHNIHTLYIKSFSLVYLVFSENPVKKFPNKEYFFAVLFLTLKYARSLLLPFLEQNLSAILVT